MSAGRMAPNVNHSIVLNLKDFCFFPLSNLYQNQQLFPIKVSQIKSTCRFCSHQPVRFDVQKSYKLCLNICKSFPKCSLQRKSKSVDLFLYGKVFKLPDGAALSICCIDSSRRDGFWMEYLNKISSLLRSVLIYVYCFVQMVCKKFSDFCSFGGKGRKMRSTVDHSFTPWTLETRFALLSNTETSSEPELIIVRKGERC